MPLSASPRSILVIKPSSLGDVVHTLPAVAQLKRAHSSCRITWLINPEWAPLLQGNPSVDEILIFPRRDFRHPSKWRALLRWGRALRGLAPDVVCDFQGLLRSGLLAQLSRGKVVYGLADAREGAGYFYDQTAEVTARQHAVQRYLALARLLGAAETAALEFPLPPGNQPAGFTIDQPFVLLHPFSRGRGKSLALSDVNDLCEMIAPLPVVVVGAVAGGARPATSNCIDLLNATSLHELIWLIRAAAFTVSVDSGPMHMAAAITDRLLSLHTWSDPRLVGPCNPKAWIWKDGRIVQMQDYHASPAAKGQPATDISKVATFIRNIVAERA